MSCAKSHDSSSDEFKLEFEPRLEHAVLLSIRWSLWPQALAVVAVMAAGGSALPIQASAFQLGPDPLTEDQQILHVLNRLGFGPRPGDVARVREMGIEAYIEQQFHPESIPTPRLDEVLVGYDVSQVSREAARERDRPAVARAERNRESVMMRARSRGREPVGTDLSTADRLREHIRNGTLSADVTRMDRRWEDQEYVATLFWRAIYSTRQLEEVLVDFWFNHFNITSGDPFIQVDYGENVIRKHSLGRFEDLLIATAQHSGMLVYLDNWLSTAPKEVVDARLASWEPPAGGSKVLWRRQVAEYFETASGLNENYGRELMELHTLGVEGGYTQADVQEVARAFTGWTLKGGDEDGPFEFNPLLHVDGDKTLMGEVIPSGGMDEGMQILHMLAHHPSTALFISTKLVRKFVADEPPQAIVDAAAQRFLESDGDIREVLRAIFEHPDFFAPEYYRGKVKKPFEAVVSGLRAVDADIETVFLGPNLGQITGRMGEQLRNHEAPDGYPDVASAWVSTNSLLTRFVFAMDVASTSLRGLDEVDLDGARELFRVAEFAEPSPDQIANARELFATMQSDASGAGGGMMMDSGMPTATRPGRAPEESRPEVDYESLEAKVVAVALVLGSPDFQKR